MTKLYRSRTDCWIAGIFGGLGEIYEVDPNILRLVAFFLFLATGMLPLFLTYLLAWYLIPRKP